MNVRPEMRFDKARFFAWAERQNARHELVEGNVSVLPYVTRGHSRVCNNIVRAIGSRIDATQFDVSQGDFAVETGEHSLRYADVMIEPFNNVLGSRTTTSALVLFEVLSSSTMHVDFHEKLEEYKTIASLGTYAICAQDEARVWVWTRIDDGAWPDAPLIIEGLDAVLKLPILNTALPLADIYRNVAVR